MLNSFIKSSLMAKNVTPFPAFMQLRMAARMFTSGPTADYNRKYRGNFDLML